MPEARHGRRRALLALVATAALVGPLAWFWASSLVPSTYSVMDLGYADYGGGRMDPGHLGNHGPYGIQVAGQRSLATLTGPADVVPDVAVTLTARREAFRLGATGREVQGYTLNHTSPGPTITVRQGELLEVTLVNESVPDGVSLHWHGVDVPNAEDGVAGVTQDAVGVGDRFVYRFVVPDAGTYWYHSHQVSHEQVLKGLFGALVVLPRTAATNAPDVAGSAGSAGSTSPVIDQLALVHTYAGQRTVNGRVGEGRVDAPAGSTVRVRLIDSDNGPLHVTTTGAAFRLVATDGHEVVGATPVIGKTVDLGGGGRADLLVETPVDGSAVRVDLGGGPTYLTIGPTGAPAPPEAPRGLPQLDLLSYGQPEPLPFDVEHADRSFRYDIGRRPGFLDGRPGLWWTVNGHTFPHLPMFVVDQGDVVRLTITNHSGQAHPMHLHGHHAVVLSRNGKPADGSPWWVDTLNVEDAATYELAFVADNPGVWMDHCHNLQHAVEGLVTHLTYSHVSEPYRVGGPRSNEPE